MEDHNDRRQIAEPGWDFWLFLAVVAVIGAAFGMWLAGPK